MQLRDMTAEHQSYDPQFFAKIAAVEDKHFWFSARNRIIGAAVSSIVTTLPSGYRVLEVGCGTGTVLQELQQTCCGAEVTGMDLYPEAVMFAKQRAGCEVLIADVLDPPQLGQFDVVGMFDVLEHLPDEAAVLAGLNRLMKIGAALVITVPAHMSLWSYFDVSSCHCRRYERPQLAARLSETGFEVEYLTEFMMAIFPLVWLGRRLKGGKVAMDKETSAAKAANELKITPGINWLLKAMLSQESHLVARRWRLPIGTSLLAVARKRSEA